MRIVFADLGPWDYDVATPLERPLGGSQSALCYLGAALAQRGHQVTLLSGTKQPRTVRGVACHSCQNVPPALLRHECDVLVVLNGPAEKAPPLRQYLNPSCPLILWTQHAADQPAMAALRQEAVQREWDRIVCVSDWQRSTMIEQYHIDSARVVVLRNAMAPAFESLFRNEDELVRDKTSRLVLAYTSTPYRGLAVLLRLFPEVRRSFPGLELHVYSSLQVYQQEEREDKFRGLYEECRRTLGVTYFGSIAQPQLAAALKKASVLAYPNTFAETSCIAVMEALAAGLFVVTSDFGALPETTMGFAALVPSIDRAGSEGAFAQRFWDRLRDVLQVRARDPIAFARKCWSQVMAINEQSTWQVRAQEWEALLDACLRRTVGDASTDRVPNAVVHEVGQSTAADQLNTALNEIQAGRLSEAEIICRQVLRAAPQEAEAYRVLGIIAHQVGNNGAAAALLQKAIDLNPASAICANNLSFVLALIGRFAEAEAAARQALALQPENPTAWNNLAHALRAQGRLSEAEAGYRRALELHPGYAQAENNLGTVLLAQGRMTEAEAAFRRALALYPGDAEALSNLGSILQVQGKVSDAEAAFRRASSLSSNPAVAAGNLGNILQAQGLFAEAEMEYRKALAFRPDYPEVEHNLSELLLTQGRLAEAEAACRRALALRPDFVRAENQLAAVLQYSGRIQDAMTHLQRALNRDPTSAFTRSNALLLMQYTPGVTLERLAMAHAEWDEHHATSFRREWRPLSQTPDSDRPLRLGFVSGDLGRHPVGYLLVRTLEALRSHRCVRICYSDQLHKDDLASRIAGAADVWREVHGQPDEALAELIRNDQVDILFDLAGHTRGNRMLLFARKPAPIQVTWLGYVGTTGLAAMDYLLADRFHVPPGVERVYREQVLRLPDGYACYDPPADAPPVGPLPARAAGHITFGSFNNPAKITPPVIAVWAEILRRVAGARLVLKYKWFDDPATQRRYRDWFAEHGVTPERIDLLGWSPHAELLAHYNRIDIALDPFPYSGGLTTCEALWMGVPVVTCPGETFASRHSLSHLSNVGLTETVVAELPAYVERAVELAGDLERLVSWRADLRERVRCSPLCDGVRFADNLMGLLRDAWRRWSSLAEAKREKHTTT